MSKLHISPDIALPEDVVTSTLVVYGGKGMGKTTLGSVLVEELTKARLRWCLLDPMGVAWGLRHSKDGKGPGVECVILGGAQGDIPIEPTGGAIVADLVVDENVNTIIDFSRKASGEMWSIGEKVRFVTEYTLRLFRRQGELVDGKRREPLMQILDEAARYIPQVIPSGAIDLAKCVGAWEQVCEEGRNIGLGVTFLTQRSARMNKSVSELADVMFAFRTVGPNSLAAVMDWLGEHVEKARARELASKVRELEVGQALLVSPGWLRAEAVVRIRDRETFDSSATPKPGQSARRVTGAAAKPDLAKYQTKMAATIEKVKADDPKALRQRIAELEREIKAKPAPSGKVIVDEGAVIRAVARAIAEERKATDRRFALAIKDLRGFVHRLGAVKTVVTDLAALSEQFEAMLGTSADSRAEVQVGNQTQGTGANHPAESAVGRSSQAPARPIATPRASSNGTSGAVGGTSQRMLNALRFLESVGTSPASRPAIAGLVGISWDTGTFRTYLSELRSKGFIADGPSTSVSLTDSGRAQASDHGLPRTQSQLHDAWLSKVGGTPGRMLRVLLEEYPDAVTRTELGQACGIDHGTGTFRTYLSELRSPGLLVDVDKQTVRAADALFPEGLDR